MRTIKALIVDDEELDRELLRNLINNYCTFIGVQGEAATVSEAEQLVRCNRPDVVFLDIHMPGANGFSLLERFPGGHFLTVLTTAYDDYGIKAVKAGALDYLLKPLDVDELLEAEKKLLNTLHFKEHSAEQMLQLYDKGRHVMVNTGDIVCLEAEGSYVRVHLSNAPSILVARNIKQLSGGLPAGWFKRVHRSYVIHTGHITGYRSAGSDLVVQLSNGLEARVSRQFKPIIKKMLLQ